MVTLALAKSISVLRKSTCTLFHFICTNQLLGYAVIPVVTVLFPSITFKPVAFDTKVNAIKKHIINSLPNAIEIFFILFFLL